MVASQLRRRQERGKASRAKCERWLEVTSRLSPSPIIIYFFSPLNLTSPSTPHHLPLAIRHLLFSNTTPTGASIHSPVFGRITITDYPRWRDTLSHTTTIVNINRKTITERSWPSTSTISRAAQRPEYQLSRLASSSSENDNNKPGCIHPPPPSPLHQPDRQLPPFTYLPWGPHPPHPEDTGPHSDRDRTIAGLLTPVQSIINEPAEPTLGPVGFGLRWWRSGSDAEAECPGCLRRYVHPLCLSLPLS